MILLDSNAKDASLVSSAMPLQYESQGNPRIANHANVIHLAPTWTRTRNCQSVTATQASALANPMSSAMTVTDARMAISALTPTWAATLAIVTLSAQ